MNTLVDTSDFIGAPWQAGGRGPAYDCWGIVHAVRVRFGLETPAFVYGADVPDDPGAVHSIIQAALSGRGWVPCAPEPGAVLAIRWSGPYVNHCGVVVGPDTFLHCLNPIGVHLARMSSPAYRLRIAGVYAWKP